jgi:hypothetical protein
LDFANIDTPLLEGSGFAGEEIIVGSNYYVEGNFKLISWTS